MSLNLALYSNTATISTTEYSLTNNSTSIAAKTDTAIIQVFLDLNALAAGDEFELCLLEKVASGGTQRRAVLGTLTIADALYVTGTFLVGVGWDVTLKRIAGSDRSITWSIRSVS